MRINNINNKSAFLISPIIFSTIGAIKTYHDTKNADEKDKTRVLVHDISVLSSAGLGFILSSFALKKFYNLNIGKKLQNQFLIYANKIRENEKIANFLNKHEIQKSEKNFKTKNIQNGIGTILKDCFDATLTTTIGLLTALGVAKYILPEILNKIPDDIKKEKNNSHVSNSDKKEENNIISEKLTNIFKNEKANTFIQIISDYPELKGLGGAMISLAAHDIVSLDEKNEKMKLFTYDILSSTLIPTIFISLATLCTKNIKKSVKVPIILSSVFIGGFLGIFSTKFFKKYIDKIIDNKIFKIEDKT